MAGIDITRAKPSWFLLITAHASCGKFVESVRTFLPGWLAPADVGVIVPAPPYARLIFVNVSSEKSKVICAVALSTITATGVGCSSIEMSTVVGFHVTDTPASVQPMYDQPPPAPLRPGIQATELPRSWSWGRPAPTVAVMTIPTP